MLTLTLPSPRKLLLLLVAAVLGLSVLVVVCGLVAAGVMWTAVHLGIISPAAPPATSPAKEIGR
jgi:hypothetical protein